MVLPAPTLSFTVPSIHDDSILQCRIYHPKCLAPTAASQLTDWHKKAAIIAHPYAPLGGCYDDPVVGLVAGTVLEQGFVVCTFNFRGAGRSRGRTSWQSKAEQNDYISLIGFVVYYMHLLNPPPITPPPIEQPKFTRSDPEMHNLTPVPSQALPPPHTSDPRYLSPTSSLSSNAAAYEPTYSIDSEPRLLLGGYSYGALIASCLPSILGAMLAPFQNPQPGSAHAEIRLRAESLAMQQNEVINSQISSLLSAYRHRRGRSLQFDELLTSPKTRKANGGVRMGGEEDLRRASHDSHRSRNSFTAETHERVRRSVDRVRSITHSSRFSPRRENSGGSLASSYISKRSNSNPSIDQEPHDEGNKVQEEKATKEIPGIGEGLKTAYLLVSPLQGWINSLATMFTFKSGRDQDFASENEMKFTIDPTLAVFGDDDIFVSVKKLRAWVEKLEKAGKGGENSHFRHREVAGAGHFWLRYEAVTILEEEVRNFVNTL
ncbi:hypothetical protein G7Y89_g10886 [Cudoniella acicularis]|uniref:Uncharacterized protein n=1 Tax=Cudoniella acicularis TaxID=354080 RepID=A0A8H4VYK2_9HELO|nr:hypothetical protein G7Y89_g10886 [Cudoniella acicularis]